MSLKVKGEWWGIPGHWLEDGKRFVATAYGWAKLRERGKRDVLWCECTYGEPKTSCGKFGQEWHHRFGRGGGKRDDRVELPDGTRNLLWVNRECHDGLPIEERWQQLQEAGN